MAEIKVVTPVNLTHKGRLGFLLKDSAIYGVAAALSTSTALITFPILTRHFTVANYGVLDYFMILATFLSTLFIFGQDSAVARYFYEYESFSERRQVISQSLFFQISGLMLLLPLLWWGANWLANLLIDAPDTAVLFRIVLLQLPFLLLINFSRNLLKWTFARTRFLIMSMGYAIVQASMLVAAAMLGDSVEDVLLFMLVSNALFGMLGLYLVRQWLIFPSSFQRLCEMLPFAIPCGIISMLAAFSPTVERTMTEKVLGLDDLGLYAAGAMVALLISLVGGAFQTAWGPFSLSLYKQQDSGHTYSLVLRIFAMGMCVTVLILSLLAQLLINLLASERYSAAAMIVFPLAMGLAIQATSWISEIGIGISKRSYLHLYGHTLGLVGTIVGILVLAPLFGLLGVGLGVMVGRIIKAIISSWLAQRAHPLPWQYAQVFLLFGLTLSTGLLSIIVDVQWGSLARVVTLIVGLGMVLGVGWKLLLTSPERRGVIDLVQSRLARIPK